MPPRKRTTSSKPPARRPAPANSRPAPEPDDDYADPAEAQEIEANGHYVTAPLLDEELRIIPPGAWRQSWQRLLQQGQVDAFAELVVHPDDVEVYMELDPTNDEWGEFIAEAGRRAGESLGKSPGPAARSRSTRRR